MRLMQENTTKLFGVIFVAWSILNLFGELIVAKMGLAYDSSGVSSVIWWIIKSFTFPVWIGREFMNSFFDLPKSYETVSSYFIAIILIWLTFIAVNRLVKNK